LSISEESSYMPIKPVTQSGLAGQYMPLSIARMIWKRKGLIVAVTTVLTCLGVLYIMSLPSIYRAETVVLVDAQKIPEKFVASTVQVSLQDSLNSIQQQVLSSDRLMAVVKNNGLYKKERKSKTSDEVLAKMRDDLTVKVEKGFSDGKPGAFSIAYEGPDPEADQRVVKEIANLFIQENIVNREKRAEGTSEFLDSQLVQAKHSLDVQESSLGDFKTRFVGELPEQEAALLTQMNGLQMQQQANEEAINRAHQNRTVLETTLKLAENAKGQLERTLAQQRAAASAPPAAPGQEAAVHVADVPASVKLRADLETLRVRYYDGHPEVRRLQAELNQALAAEAKAAAVAAAQAKAHPEQPEAPVRLAGPPPGPAEIAATNVELKIETERAATTKAQIETVDQELKTRLSDRDRIQADLAKIGGHVGTLPIREQQMAALMRDYETSKLNYKSLLDKKISAEMAKDMEKKKQSEGFAIADEARVPDFPVRPRRMAFSIGAFLGSLAFALLLAFALEVKKNSFLGEWELPAGVAVIGRIPHVGEVNS
jgi:succinoglycan biosynthesis transport protein ExoP